jgi:hypothetical protein
VTTDPGEPALEAAAPLPAPVRLLSVLVAVQAVLMVTYLAVDVVSAIRSSGAEWGAVWFALVVLGLWSVGLLWVSRGVLAGKRWAFTPILFTQLIFGAVAISVFGAADTVAKIVWALVVVYAVVVLRLLFSREVRQHLVYSQAS